MTSAATPGAPVTVLFLAGIGRSGTTLLERVVGEVPGTCALGEVMHLWERGLGRGERCGCGELFAQCPFWAPVGVRAFGGWDRVDLDRMAVLKRRVDRASRVPLVALGRAGGLADDVAEYAAAHAAVYRAAAEVSGARVVIDSSKQVSLAWCLHASQQVDLRLVHCVRDSRGVAHSWSRDVARPEAVSSEHDRMPRYSPATVSALWLLHNAEIEALARRVPSVRLRYEDFVREPSASTARVLRLAEVEAGPPDIGPSGVQLGTSHSCAGNPMRFVQGPVQVRCDERWRTEQDLGVRRLVTTLTKPLLHRYHYST